MNGFTSRFEPRASTIEARGFLDFGGPPRRHGWTRLGKLVRVWAPGGVLGPILSGFGVQGRVVFRTCRRAGPPKAHFERIWRPGARFGDPAVATRTRLERRIPATTRLPGTRSAFGPDGCVSITRVPISTERIWLRRSWRTCPSTGRRRVSRRISRGSSRSTGRPWSSRRRRPRPRFIPGEVKTYVFVFKRILGASRIPPAHPETMPRRVEVSREVREQRGGQPNRAKEG